MKSLLKYLSSYKKECVLAPLFKMLEASFELFVPLVIAAIIDKGIIAGDKTHIYKSVGLLFVLALVGLVSAITAQFFAAKAAVGFATNVRKDLYSHLLSLSYKEYDDLGTSTMMTRMTSDVMQTQSGVNMFLRLTLRSPFVVIGAMIMAFTIDAKAASIFALVIIILSIFVAVLMKVNIPLIKKAQASLDKLLLYTRENLAGARVLRAFVQENEEKDRYKNGADRLYSNQITASRISAIMNPGTYIIINLAIVCLIYVGALRVNSGNLTQGSVVALYNYMSQILVELIKLANMIVTLNKAIASGDRIAGVFGMKNSQESDTNSEDKIIDASKNYTGKIIEFNDISFKYNKDGDDALSNISFSVNEGEFVGVIGGTGAGKTTLLNLIPRYYDTTKGQVKVFGENVDKWNIESLRKKVGFVFQKASLFSGTIASNLRLSKDDASDDEILEAMHLAVADDVISAKGGINSDIGQGGKALSGGQRQRITIARALVTKAPILIFDDSTSALDFATQKKFIENIREIEYKPTVIVASQRANAVMKADKIIVLDDGNMVGIGTHDELLKNCEVYKEIYDTQFGGNNSKANSQEVK